MRLTAVQIQVIKQTAYSVLGTDTKVIPFGTRTDDTKKHGRYALPIWTPISA